MPFARLGEALRWLVCDWSLSLASENCCSSPNLNPVFARVDVFADAAAASGKAGAMVRRIDDRKEAKIRQKVYPAHVICPSVCIIEYQCCVALCALSSTSSSAF